MTPNADQIARVIVDTSSVAGVDPEKTLQGHFSGVYGGRIGKARAATCFSLACVHDRSAEGWAVRFGWSANEKSATGMLGRKRLSGLLRSPVIAAATSALGIKRTAPVNLDNRIAAQRRQSAAKKRADARATRAKAAAATSQQCAKAKSDAAKAKAIAEAERACEETAKVARAAIAKDAPPKRAPLPSTTPAITEDDAARALLGKAPASRSIPSSGHIQGSPTGPRGAAPSKPSPAGRSVTKVKRPADVEAMKASLVSRLTPKSPSQSEDTSGVAPLDTAFLHPVERRIIERCIRLQRGGSGLNDIRLDLLNELKVRKSMDWIARACVTVLQDDAA